MTMFVFRRATYSLIVILSLGIAPSATGRNYEEPINVTVAQLVKDPATYNHKLVKVSGMVSHGFENFTIYEEVCQGGCSIWLEYGGKLTSQTTYCCGPSADRKRSDTLTIDNIEIPLAIDKNFEKFDKLIHSKRKMLVRASLVGRFFTDKLSKDSSDNHWGGYGHFGVYSLLAIQQVVFVHP